MACHANMRIESEQAKREREPALSKVGAVIVGAENGEVGTRDIVLCKRRATNRKRNHVLHEIPIGHRSYDQLF